MKNPKITLKLNQATEGNVKSGDDNPVPEKCNCPVGLGFYKPY